MIYSGLDWSGNPGPTHGPFLVTAIVHVDDADRATLDVELAEARSRLGWRPDFVFKHQGAKPHDHREFYAALRRISFSAHVHMLDKAAWRAQYSGQRTRGDDCIGDAITSVVLGCPQRFTADQILYIDLPHKERMTLNKYRELIRSALRGADRETFRHIKARPDNQLDGGIIQIADMICGEINEQQGMSGPYLSAVQRSITIVGA